MYICIKTKEKHLDQPMFLFLYFGVKYMKKMKSNVYNNPVIYTSLSFTEPRPGDRIKTGDVCTIDVK